MNLVKSHGISTKRPKGMTRDKTVRAVLRQIIEGTEGIVTSAKEIIAQKEEIMMITTEQETMIEDALIPEKETSEGSITEMTRTDHATDPEKEDQENECRKI